MHAHRPFLLIVVVGLFASLARPSSAAVAPLDEPCCQITAIQANGAVTARDTKTGQVFTFKVTDQAVLAGLHIGQPVWADFGTKKVSLGDGLEPCCQLTGPAAYGPVSGARLPAVAPAQPCCQVVANASLTGRLGRLMVAFPDGADASATHIAVFKAAGNQQLRDVWGALTLDLLPGTYTVVISGKPVTGVTVQAGHDTRVRAGMVRVKAGSNAHVVVMDVNDKTQFADHWGSYVVGLPVGTVHLQINGQTEAVTIEDNKITEF